MDLGLPDLPAHNKIENAKKAMNHGLGCYFARLTLRGNRNAGM
jgi:hypothetical protein